MPWAKVDDKLHGHPKAAKAGLEALGLHLLAMSHCAAYGTEGHVDPEFPKGKAAGKSKGLVRRLVDSGLWEENGTGWVIHDWLDYNPTNEQSRALSEARAQAGKRGGKAQANAQASAFGFGSKAAACG